MKVISERIVNIADMEAKIRSARMCADSALENIQNGKIDRSEYLLKKLSLALHELTEFEFVLEQREVIQ